MAGAPRACRPTMWRTFFASARSHISFASRLFAPSGHSQKTCLPALSAAVTRSRWPGTRTQTDTMSTSGCAASSSGLVKAWGMPYLAAVALVVSACLVHTAATWNSGMAVSAGRWARVPHPWSTLAPMMPMPRGSRAI